jgi:hypothetical protein
MFFHRHLVVVGFAAVGSAVGCAADEPADGATSSSVSSAATPAASSSAADNGSSGTGAGEGGSGGGDGDGGDGGGGLGAGGGGGPPLVEGCNCGSIDAEAPCLGTEVSHTLGGGDRPPSTISFAFRCDDGACACGRFANGYDYWVSPRSPGGIVEIVEMTPAATGAADASLRNGWVRDPSATLVSTGMDGRLGDMATTGQPINPSESEPAAIETAAVAVTTIVKSHSMLETGETSCGGTDEASGLSRHCFWHAEALTVLDRPPAGAGSTVLRPPLTGEEKPLLSTAAIDFAALPNLPPPTRGDGTAVSGPSWEDAVDRLGPPKIEWGASGNYTYWQYMPPMYNFASHESGYPPRSFQALLDAAQLLALDGSGHEAEKRLLAIRTVQWGIDLYYMWKARGFGAMYKPNGGHAVGRYLAPVLAAALLTGPDGDAMKADLMRVNNGTSDKCGFDVSGELWHWSDTDRVLYGYFNIPGCGGYSDYTQQTNSNYVDPAHLGDNGRLAENADNSASDVNSCFGAYQPITLGPTQATANLVRAIPAARAIAYEHMIPYVTRVVDHGAYCRPDHTPAADYAQAFGTCDGGVNVGEQCRNAQDCPSAGCVGDNNQYTSWLARNMWAKYEDCYDTNSCPGM